MNIKKFLLVSLVGVTLFTQSQLAVAAPDDLYVDPYTGEANKEVVEFCQSTGELAGSIMEARVNGVPISKALSIASDSHASVRSMTEIMVIDAYLNPEYQYGYYLGLYENYFAAKYYLECINYFEID